MNKVKCVFISILIFFFVFSGMVQVVLMVLISIEQVVVVMQVVLCSEVYVWLQVVLDCVDLVVMLQVCGVLVDEMWVCVDVLIDVEVQQMLQQIDNVLVGSSDVVGVLFMIFIILLVIDIFGFIKVFLFMCLVC